MGTDYVYERGGLALQNCQFFDINKLSTDVSQLQDSLMCGVGTGFSGMNANLDYLQRPAEAEEVFVIPDSREGWAESTKRLLESYETGGPTVRFDYSQIRPYGAAIRGFGGVSSGSAPLEQLHERVRDFLNQYVEGEIDQTRLIADVVNSVGACTVAGNVRRSAQLMLGSPSDDTFLNLKNYDMNPERGPWGFMSNNSIACWEPGDYANLPEIAERIRDNGEPGVVNFNNIREFARFGEAIPDTAIGTNPCSEATLESFETCNLCELFPTKCKTEEEFYDAAELATIYASTVALLMTHQERTNIVLDRNRRIGVSLSGIADWFDEQGATRIVTMMRKAYRIIEDTNRTLAREAGVPESIRKTVIKPSGTVSTVAGVSPGMHYPPYTAYIRRVRFGDNTPLVPLLIDAGVPHESDAYSENTSVFEFPVRTRAKRSQRDLSMWQKGAMVMMLQRHFADQMVSNTVTFHPEKEGGQLEDFLAFTVPMVKSLSLLPDTDDGAYQQMPFEGITVKEFERRSREMRDIDWHKFSGSDGEDSRFCEAEGCTI